MLCGHGLPQAGSGTQFQPRLCWLCCCRGVMRSRCLTQLHVLLLKPVNTWDRVADLSGVCALHLQLAGVRMYCLSLVALLSVTPWIIVFYTT